MNYTLKEIKVFWQTMRERKKRELKELLYTIRLAVWGDERTIKALEKWL